MNKKQALDYWYYLQSLAANLSVDKHHMEAEKAWRLAEDLVLIYHISSNEIESGKTAE